MSIILDLAMIAIVAYCAWRGYKIRFIVTLCGVVAMIVCICGANIVSSIYSNEFTGLLEPFVGGMVDGAVSDVISDDEEGLVVILTDAEKEDPAKVGHAALRTLGLSDAAAAAIADEAAQEVDTVGQRLADNLADKVCGVLAFAMVFGIVFILLCIIFAAIGNVLNLSLTIPGYDLADGIAGAVAGFCKGLIFVLFITCMFRYLGLIISEQTIEKTILTEWLINHNMVANIIGV